MIAGPDDGESGRRRGRRRARLPAPCAASLAALLLLVARTASAQGYTVTDLGTLGGSSSDARAINLAGQVIGTATLPGDSARHAYLWDNGIMRDLGTLGGTSSNAGGINAWGQVVGFSSLAGSSTTHAFLYDSGGMHDLGTSGSSSSVATGVNDAGWITGTANWPAGGNPYSFIVDGGGMRVPAGARASNASFAFAINASGQVVGQAAVPFYKHAVRYDPSGIHDLGTLGGSYSEAYDINDAGQIVGSSDISPGSSSRRAFLFDNQGMHDLGALDNGDISVALAINSAGQIVGRSRKASVLGYFAFLYFNGVMTDLNSLLAPGSGWVLNEAYDINDRGQIVGYGTHNGQSHAFLLTPPAPAAPGGLTVTAISDTQVYLSWMDNSPDETAFALWRQTGSGSFIRLGVLTPNTTAVVDGSVSPGTTYTYELRAIGLGGASAWSNQATITPALPALAPPTFLTAAMLPRAQVRLSWVDNSSNETAFAIWRQTGGGSYTRIGVVPPNTTSFTDAGVSPGTAYTYRVRATNDTVASAWSSEAALLIPAQPVPPDQISATASVRLIGVSWSWTNNTHLATALELYRKPSGGAYTLLAVLPPDTTSYTDTGLSSNTTYSYQVRTANDYFASAWSQETSAITGP